MTPTPHPDTPPRHRMYSRADAIDDGLLVEVPTRLSRQFGITWPLAVTTLAWFDAIGWDSTCEHSKPRPTHETESGRIAEVLFAARLAVTTNPTGAHTLLFAVHRVPPTGTDTRSTRCTLQITIHPGDHGETVATISHPTPAVAGRFIVGELGHPSPEFPAVGYDQGPDHTLWPIVTTDTLDTILTEAGRRHPDLTTTQGDHAIHIQQTDSQPVTLRPDDRGRYHLRPLHWDYQLI